jgi:hypothetical protein
MTRPLCIELFCGSFGWSAGWLELGGRAIGFDIEHLPHHGSVPAGASLVIQDVLTLAGSQFSEADLILASPPCTQYSYLAMPWSRSTSEHSQAAKALRRKWETEGADNRLFDACFRIQREAIEATKQDCHHCDRTGKFPNGNKCYCCNGTGRRGGHHIPLIVENVRGAQEWVGPAKANYGSFYLWSADVDMVGNRIVIGGASFSSPMIGAPSRGAEKTAGGSWFRERNGEPQPSIRHEDRGRKGIGCGETPADGSGATSWFGKTRCDPRDVRRDEDGDFAVRGTKIGGDWFSDPNSTCRKHGSRSNARKAASAHIAKIPLALSQFIARSFKPKRIEAAA